MNQWRRRGSAPGWHGRSGRRRSRPLPLGGQQLPQDLELRRAGWVAHRQGVGHGQVPAGGVPDLLDRHAGLETAIWTSVRATAANPGPMACWGLIVAFGLAIGSLPALLGLAVVMPVLGHATWHLYRRLVAPAGPGRA